MGRPKLAKNIPKNGILFRCKYGHTRCKGGEVCERVMRDAAEKAGRPCDWRPEINDLLVEFFRSPPVGEYVSSVTTRFHEETGKKTYEKSDRKQLPKTVPFFGAFERKMGLSHGTLSRWVKAIEEADENEPEKYPGFLDAYNAAKELQKEFLISLGLSGLVPPAAFCFVAKNLTDMRDQREIGGLGGGPITFGWADEDEE